MIKERYLHYQEDISMGHNMIKTAAEVAVVVISYILAFMTYQRIDPEKFIRPDGTQLAGEDIPRLSGREEFEALAGTEPVTAEPEEVVATGVYGLKPWVDPYKITRTTTPNGRMVGTGRRAPDATDSAAMAVEHYQEYYLIRLPDQTYILAQFGRMYREEMERGVAVTLPAGVKKPVSVEAQKYLKEICGAYGADCSCVLYMIDDEWQQRHDFQFFIIKLGIAAAVFFAMGIPLFALVNRVTGGKGR